MHAARAPAKSSGVDLVCVNLGYCVVCCRDREAGQHMTDAMVSYFDSQGYPCPAFSNAADHAGVLEDTAFTCTVPPHLLFMLGVS